MKINILVLNYNGKDLLDKCLASVLSAAQKSKYNCRVSVVDNASRDGSAEFVRNRFPDALIFEQKNNKVLCSYNDVIREIDDDIVILLNNDMSVENNFVDILAETIEKDADVFMAAPKILTQEGENDGSNTKASIRYGIFWASAKYDGFEKNLDNEGITFSAGVGAFDRKKFLMLGGYDELYLPGTLEDSDICFRAWKRGWKCVYQPKSIIYHMGQVSFHRKFGKRQTEIINFRNVFLFMWKNMTDKRILFEHFIFTPPRLLYSTFTGKPELLMGFMKAVPKLRDALEKRNGIADSVKKTDREIFNLFKV